ncbi:MAG: restriction endonuclease subunit S [Dissulfurispiraceae bacterium]
MSFPRYANYKDSRVEWLGEVPAHWQVTPLFCAASKREDSNAGMAEDNLLSLSYGRIVQKDINSSDGLLPESFETYQIVRPGDVVFRLTDLQNDKRSLRTAIVEETGIITSAYVVVAPVSILPHYLNHLLRSYDVMKVFYSMGGGLRQSMKFSDLRRLPILFPPDKEQAAIAKYLDRETGKIDALINEQHNLINLLKEKRQALISHAVTKGLNPNAKMKDSGVEWLGEVPEHWEVRRLKNSLRLLTEKTDRRERPVALENIESWSGRFIETNSELEGDGVAFERGDILFGKLRPYLAKVYLAEAAGEAVGDFHVMRPAIDIDGLFAQYQILNRDFIAIVDGSTFGAKMPRVSWDFLGNMRLSTPRSIQEQQAIATFLDHESGKMDALIAEAETAITFLQERRTALISAAVTGKIDVRELK